MADQISHSSLILGDRQDRSRSPTMTQPNSAYPRLYTNESPREMKDLQEGIK
ncbi:hypothetical protein LguiA_035926 [Lonicera macranthoides]